MESIKSSPTKFYLILFSIILAAVIIGAVSVFLLRPQAPLSPHGHDGNGIMIGPHGETPTAQPKEQAPGISPKTQETGKTYPYSFTSTNVAHNAQMRYGLNLRAVKYLWDFGDGQTSTERNPVHEYQALGAYTIKLTVTLEDGNIYSETTTITVK